MPARRSLVDYGFRLPSALDNRPLSFDEFEQRIHQVVYISATPGPYELKHSQQVVEQLVRPTGLLEPTVEIKPTKGQIDDLIDEIKQRVARGERCLVTTLTKRMAEDLADYLIEMGIKTHYLHSEIETLERVEILRDLRLGVYDVVVGINLLREGLDLPEVSLVAILDADKEGYLRSEGSLIQTMGRAARHVDGHVIMYADTVTQSMQARHRRDRAPAGDPGGLQQGARHHAAGHPQGDQGHHRPREGGGRAARPVRGDADPERRHRPADQGPRVADEGGGAEPRVREGGPAAGPDR